MNLVINHKHTAGIEFDNRTDGALIRAARQQQPELNIVQEFDGYCVDAKRNHYDFNSSEPSGYNRNTFQQLQNKEIKEISITLELNRIY